MSLTLADSFTSTGAANYARSSSAMTFSQTAGYLGTRTVSVLGDTFNFLSGHAATLFNSATNYAGPIAQGLGNTIKNSLPTVTQGAKSYFASSTLIALPVVLPVLNHYLEQKRNAKTIEQYNDTKNFVSKTKLSSEAEKHTKDAEKKQFLDMNTGVQMAIMAGCTMFMLSGAGAALTTGTLLLTGASVITGRSVDKLLTLRRANTFQAAADNIKLEPSGNELLNKLKEMLANL